MGSAIAAAAAAGAAGAAVEGAAAGAAGGAAGAGAGAAGAAGAGSASGAGSALGAGAAGGAGTAAGGAAGSSGGAGLLDAPTVTNAATGIQSTPAPAGGQGIVTSGVVNGLLSGGDVPMPEQDISSMAQSSVMEGPQSYSAGNSSTGGLLAPAQNEYTPQNASMASPEDLNFQQPEDTGEDTDYLGQAGDFIGSRLGGHNQSMSPMSAGSPQSSVGARGAAYQNYYQPSSFQQYNPQQYRLF